MAARTIEIGKLRAELGLDTAQYVAGARVAAATNQKLTADMRRTQAAVQQMASAFSTAKLAWGTFAGTFAGAALHSGIAALVNLGKEAIATAGDLVDMSQRTGISIEALQRMDFVAGQTGATLEQFTKAAFQLGVRLNSGSGSVKQAVRDLGLELNTLKAMRPEDQFATTLEALGRISDADKRNALGVALYGKAVAAVLPAAAEGYRKLAAEAKAAGDAQVLAIDKIADSWAAMLKQLSTGAIQLGGSFALGLQALKDMTAMERMQVFLLAGAANPLETVIKLGEVRAKTLADQANAQRAAAEATKAATKADESYKQQLAEARVEMSKLTGEQRQQIDAARKLGVSVEDIAEALGLTPAAIQLYIDAAKKAEDATKALNDELAKLSEERAKEVQRAMEKTAEAMAKFEDQAAAEAKRKAEEFAARVQRDADEVISMKKAEDEALGQFEDERVKDAKLREEILKDQTEVENAEMRRQAEIQRQHLEHVRQMWERFSDDITFSVTDGFADMLVGLRGFKDAMVGIWRDIRRAVANVLSQMLADFIGGYVRGAVAAMAGRGAAGITGGASGLVAGGPNVGGGIGLGGLGGLSPLAIGIGTGIGGGIALAWAIKEKGLFRGGEEASQVSPRRDRFFGQFGGSDKAAGLLKSNQLMRGLFAADTVSEWQSAQSAAVMRFEMMGRKVQSFETGGFVPPGVTQPAILHGGTHGEVVMPLDKAAARGTVVNNYWTISGLDGQDVLRVVKDKIAPALTHMQRFNVDGYTTQQKLALGIR